MPFGRHRGKPLGALPFDYLCWLRTRDLYEPLRSHCEVEWQRRLGQTRDDYTRDERPRREEAGALVVAAKDREMFRELLTAGFRQLCLKLHPDVGGKPEDMRKLNLLMEELRRQMRN
jgi:hypothetical protein